MTGIRPFPNKDSSSNLRYYWDWSPWVAVEDGGVIESYDVAVDEGDGALVLGDRALSGSFIMQWISGGTLGVVYTVRARVTLTDGSTEDASRTIEIVEK